MDACLLACAKRFQSQLPNVKQRIHDSLVQIQKA